MSRAWEPLRPRSNDSGTGRARLTVMLQLAAAAGLILVMAIVHGLGVVGITRLLDLDADRLRAQRLGAAAIATLSAVALLLFLLHLIEFGLFAAFYLAVGALGTMEEALFFSASAYATLAQPVQHFPESWRLLGAIEGLVGFLLIGWSTAFFVTDMNHLLRD